MWLLTYQTPEVNATSRAHGYEADFTINGYFPWSIFHFHEADFTINGYFPLVLKHLSSLDKVEQLRICSIMLQAYISSFMLQNFVLWQHCKLSFLGEMTDWFKRIFSKSTTPRKRHPKTCSIYFEFEFIINKQLGI